MKLKYLSLFSGIGGFERAIHSVFPDAVCVGFSEVDKYAVKTYKKHYPEHPSLGDITEIDPHSLPDFDLMVGGWPCQDLSIAKNNRQGLEGERSGLFWKMIDIHKAKKPKWFLYENVYSMDARNKGIISRAIADASGYSTCIIDPYVEPVMIDAAKVSGMNRSRLYWCNWYVEQPKEKGIRLRDVLVDAITPDMKSLCIGAHYDKAGVTARGIKDYLDKKKRQLVIGTENVKGDIPERIAIIGRGGQAERIYSMDGKAVTQSGNGGGLGANTGIYLVINLNPSGRGMNGTVYDADGKAPTITTNKGEGQKILIETPHIVQKARGNNKGGIKALDGKVPTITANSYHENNLVNDGYVLRVLCPLEVERLFCFPDGWTEGVSKRQRYRQLGNAVCVAVIEHILKELKEEK